MTIKAGDNGTILEHSITSDGAIVPLNGATVTVTITTGNRRFTKTATITDSTNGICQVTLTSDDIATPGTYLLEGIVTEASGNEYASDIVVFLVGERL